MERNPYAISVESNPYQIELAGHEHGKVADDGRAPTNEYAPSSSTASYLKMPTRASISRQGKALIKGVQDRGGCRLAICLIGVALCWLCSLQVANAFVEILFTPANGGPKVQQSWQQFGAQVNVERERNIECVNASLGNCVTVLQADFNLMEFDVEIIALQNSYLVGNATAYQQKCADAQRLKISVIQQYKLNLTQYSRNIIWNNTCDAATISNLNSLYTDPSRTANQATTATSQYGNSNEVTWAQAYQSMQARAAYDQAYWLNKTNALRSWYTTQNLGIKPPNMPNFTGDFAGFDADLSEYWACATLSNSPPCPKAGSLRASADATIQQFQSRYSTLSNTIAMQRNDSQAYLNAAAAKVQGYRSYATQVDTDLRRLKANIDALNCGQPCTDAQASFPFEPPISLPSNLNLSGYIVGGLPANPLDSLMAGLNFTNQTASIRAKLAAMTAQMNGAALNWGDSLNFSINSQFGWNPAFGVDFGYNPPPVNIDTSNVTNLTAWYVAQTNGQLSDVSAKLSTGGGTGGSGNKTTEVLRNLKLGANSISSTDYTYAALGGSFDLDTWFTSVNWFRFFLFFLDYAFRIWCSGRIFIRYWFGAAGTMPPIDIRSYRTTKATPLNVRIAHYATHPCTLFGGAMIMAILIVSTIIGLYIPMLQDYMRGCVQSDALGGGTLLGNNVYAAAFNAAVLQGNRDLSHGLSDYDTARANLCGSKQQDAQDAFANQKYQLKIVRDNLQSVVDLLDKMEKCTAMATWRVLYDNPPNRDFQYFTNYPNPTGTWHINGCTMSGFDALGFLEPPPINCTNLPTCGTQCGVDTSVVQGVSHRASCQTEWYIHSSILKLVCTIVVFIFWNICRSLLLDGLVRIYWKHLVRGTGLNFYSTCNQNGQIDTDTEDQLQVAIKESDESYRRWGYVYIAMSVLLNIPYIVFCVLLNIDIAYPY